jgi:hypothetical protein
LMIRLIRLRQTRGLNMKTMTEIRSPSGILRGD